MPDSTSARYVPFSFDSQSAASTNLAAEPKYECRATQTYPRYDLLLPGEPCALDAEFQFALEVGVKGRHRLGRVAMVNSKGQTVLDVYVVYNREEGVRKRMPPAEFMVDKRDLLFENGAVHASKVEAWVKKIVSGRKVVMHGCQHDLTAFQYEKDVFVTSEVLDTQNIYSNLQKDGTPGLRTCAILVLNDFSVQAEGHPPTEDAWAAMRLWAAAYPDAYDRTAAEIKYAEEQKDAGISTSNERPVSDQSRKPSNNDSNRRERPSYQKRNNTGTAPFHDRTVLTAQRNTKTKDTKVVEAFKLSIDDSAAFPSLGAVVGKKRD